jgi:hypothetical protein
MEDSFKDKFIENILLPNEEYFTVWLFNLLSTLQEPTQEGKNRNNNIVSKISEELNTFYDQLSKYAILYFKTFKKCIFINLKH